MAKRRTTSRQPLSEAQILECAAAFADRHGVDALTMRKVADQLGFRVMSLYHHVANKDEMLTGMVDLAASEIEPLADDDDWKAAMRTSAAQVHAVLLRHPWAAFEWSRRSPGPARIRYMESMLEVLTEAGLDPELVYHGYHAITTHIVGFTLLQLGYERVLGPNFHEVAQQFLATSADHFPYMAEHVRAHLDEEGHGDEFLFILNIILDGLEPPALSPT